MSSNVPFLSGGFRPLTPREQNILIGPGGLPGVELRDGQMGFNVLGVFNKELVPVPYLKTLQQPLYECFPRETMRQLCFYTDKAVAGRFTPNEIVLLKKMAPRISPGSNTFSTEIELKDMVMDHKANSYSIKKCSKFVRDTVLWKSDYSSIASKFIAGRIIQVAAKLLRCSVPSFPAWQAVKDFWGCTEESAAQYIIGIAQGCDQSYPQGSSRTTCVGKL